MRLLAQDTARFYRVSFVLLHHVNEQLHLVASFPKSPEGASVPLTDVLPLRNAVWADDSLRERFLDENPARLSPADLALVASWQHRLADKFFIFRHLKKYTVFLSSTSPTRAYGVLGLVSPFEEVVGPYLPVYTSAVLLPYGDQITYDGLLEPYAVSFGSGVRGDLTSAYRDIQEREGIITSLLPRSASDQPDEGRAGVHVRNARVLSAFCKDLARAGLSSKMIEQHAGTIETFAQGILLAQYPPRWLLDLTPTDVQRYLDTERASANPVSFKRFFRFLVQTGRLDPDQADALRELFKQPSE